MDDSSTASTGLPADLDSIQFGDGDESEGWKPPPTTAVEVQGRDRPQVPATEGPSSFVPLQQPVYLRLISAISTILGIYLMIELMAVGWPALDASVHRSCRLKEVSVGGLLFQALIRATFELEGSEQTCIFNRHVRLELSPAMALASFSVEQVENGCKGLLLQEQTCTLHPNFASNSKCDFGAGMGFLQRMSYLRWWSAAFLAWMLVGPAGALTSLLRFCAPGCLIHRVRPVVTAWRPYVKPVFTETASLEICVLLLHIPVFVVLCHVYAKRPFVLDFAEDVWSAAEPEQGLLYLNRTAFSDSSFFLHLRCHAE